MIKLGDILNELLCEKEDRCKRIADKRYDKPSAYKSGAIVRCRQGKIWKDLKEEIEDPTIECKNCNHSWKVSQSDPSDLYICHTCGFDNSNNYNNDLKEEESLHKWFSRQGGEGKSRGWVDCNTCKKDPKTGRKKCKPCGRQKGEDRAKYPSCRPTPSQCSREGKGKTWGKTK